MRAWEPQEDSTPVVGENCTATKIRHSGPDRPPGGDVDNSEVDTDVDLGGEDFEIESLNMTLIIMYMVAHGSGSWRCAGKAAAWVLFALLIAIVEILLLLSLTMTSNWPSCRSIGDCMVGSACVRLVEAGMLQKALCLDCYFLVDSSIHGSGKPWNHSLNGFGIPGAPDGKNATELCMAQVDVHALNVCTCVCERASICVCA
jgi:hypothetical protein